MRVVEDSKSMSHVVDYYYRTNWGRASCFNLEIVTQSDLGARYRTRRLTRSLVIKRIGRYSVYMNSTVLRNHASGQVSLLCAPFGVEHVSLDAWMRKFRVSRFERLQVGKSLTRESISVWSQVYARRTRRQFPGCWERSRWQQQGFYGIISEWMAQEN